MDLLDPAANAVYQPRFFAAQLPKSQGVVTAISFILLHVPFDTASWEDVGSRYAKKVLTYPDFEEFFFTFSCCGSNPSR